MLNPGLCPEAFRDRYRDEGIVEVDDFLAEDAGVRLLDALERQTPWELACLQDGSVRTIPLDAFARWDADERARFEHEVARQVASGFQFRFLRYTPPPADQEASGAQTVSSDLAGFASLGVLDFFRRVTADEHIRRADVHASCFAPGCYLKAHNDEDLARRRRHAYVLYLSRDWQEDWGGLLQFLDATGSRVERTVVPRFNRLTLFRVPRAHQVTCGAGFAPGQRYAINGWLTGSASAPRP